MGAMPPSGKKRKTSAKPSLKLVAKAADAKPPEAAARIQIPRAAGRRPGARRARARRRLTNLGKPFWPELGITKGDLLQYYADVAPVLLPHLRDRAMVMKRYPHGAAGEFFFMKRAPSPRPDVDRDLLDRRTARATSSTSR